MFRPMLGTVAFVVAAATVAVMPPASVPTIAGGSAASLSELLCCLFGRGLFVSLVLPIMTTTLTTGCVGPIPAGGEPVAGAAEAAAPLDAAPGVSVCATPSQWDRCCL